MMYTRTCDGHKPHTRMKTRAQPVWCCFFLSRSDIVKQTARKIGAALTSIIQTCVVIFHECINFRYCCARAWHTIRDEVQCWLLIVGSVSARKPCVTASRTSYMNLFSADWARIKHIKNLHHVGRRRRRTDSRTWITVGVTCAANIFQVMHLL